MQLATLTTAAPSGKEWFHEIKFDGFRMICRIDSSRVQFISRNHKDWTARFASLIAVARQLRVQQAILDGEVAVLQSDGTTDFQALQNAFSGQPAASLQYYVFDILYLDGYDLTKLPLERRKEILANLLRASGKLPTLHYSEHIEGNGPSFFQQACARKLEGIISKRRDRPYTPGRSCDWLKVKCLQSDEFVIGGYTEPTGSRVGFGSLQVGTPNSDGELVYAGGVGTGFNDRMLRELLHRLKPLRRDSSPFVNLKRAAKTFWVEPRLVVQLVYGSRTREGLLRHATFRGLREDKTAADVRCEVPVPVTVAAQSKTRTGRRPKSSPPKQSSKSSSAIRSASRSMAADYDSRTSTFAGVRLTSPAKIMYPDQGITKLELAQYYKAVADWILPHLADRPLVIVRCPEGCEKECFYQKHPPPGTPSALRQVAVQERTKVGNYVVVDDVAGLISLAQIGGLEIHGWGSRLDKLEFPDWLIFDLDPDTQIPWSKVVQSARQLREFLQELGLESFLKTTGGKGLHIVVPILRQHDWNDVRDFCTRLAELVVSADPRHYTASMSKAARPGKIFLDYLRNVRGATAVVPYSTRAKAGAPVSTPLAWRELSANLHSDHYNVRNIMRRLTSLKEDPWHGFTSVRQSLAGPIEALRRISIR